MKLPLHKIAAVVFIILLLASMIEVGITMERGKQEGEELRGWQLKWVNAAEGDGEHPPRTEIGWIDVSPSDDLPEVPGDMKAVWLRASLPTLGSNSAVLLNKVYGSDIRAYVDDTLVYDSNGSGSRGGGKLLIPLTAPQVGKELYIYSGGTDSSLGLEGGSRVGSYGKLLNVYLREDLLDLMIGGSLIFMAFVLGVCSVFLKRELFVNGILLMLIMLSSGVLMIYYSPYLAIVMENKYRWLELFFDAALFTLLPVFTYFFEKLFGSGQFKAVTRLRKLQMGYSLFCVGLSVLNIALSYRLDGLYRTFTVDVVGILMIIQFLLLLGLAIRYSLRGNVEAIIFTTGFAVFALASLSELSLYYMSGEKYHLYWWKWGIVGFLVSLIVIVGRRFAKNHEQVVEYSKELEKFNNDLQRSEKMEIISELAASVAHEVRNPLQVTRGFLQIIGGTPDSKEREYLQLAISELDRASHIINDFLTFAKPAMDKVECLDVGEELRHVAGILLPLAQIQGSRIEIHLEAGLYVKFNSSKFKQALINIIKNGIEALQDNGLVTITARKHGAYVVISVRDTGEGMTASEIARLGEPYYSNKTKGTGLGLMVTFRLIEAMKGTIEFQSVKGKGTEVRVKLPAVKP
ncbi:His Kinase A (phospho-acceptor) domain-containing protein [Paenibacillus sophorae]|uniref:histidine kinase n=1 Tax=Paenibacillus sophorae TaxID=1333845 RepID=A0A1H8T7B6_9BACL|nr:HAMP domain-containing sensor histidine kinase [Paenibacillus sophorae]QWU17138.1 HAMP domain-containing histidine kinase [Paenibacillus sophorae]SEO87039.1 His Kinase A (phospho-acceptor) domain-containing protein [Paenibacillus sophorae]